MKQRVWFDSGFQNNKTGIGNDSASIKKLIEAFADVRFFSYYARILKLKIGLNRKLLNLSILTFGIRKTTGNAVKGIFYQPQVSSIAPGEGISRWIIRIHDIFPITNPKWFTLKSRILFRKNFSFIVNNGANVLCSSAFTKNEILKIYPEMENRIQIYPCVPRILDNLKCNVCGGCKYLARQKLDTFLLAVGTVEPRKNYGELIDFWKDRKEFNYFDELVIVGAAGWKSILTRLKFLRNTRAGISWLGKACDGSLMELYRRCSVYISPSLSEGFNLPALEVRYYFRKPMILSDIPVHRELHNDSAFFFNNFNELKRINLSDLVKSNIWQLPSAEENIKLKKFIMGSSEGSFA